MSIRTLAAGAAPALSLALSLALLSGCTGQSAPGTSPSPGHASPSPGASAASSDSASGSARGGSSAPPSGTASASGSAGAGPSGRATPTAPPAGSCATLAGKLSLDQQIGQLFMASTASTGMSDAEARRLARLQIGSVLLLGNTTAGRSAVRDVTDRIRHRLGDQHGVRPVIAADQEGGQVQRLRGPGFDDIPSATEQASLSTDELRDRAERWGHQLFRAGVDVDLAPVADVVPSSMTSRNEPIGQLDRGYGPDPDNVARHDVAFIRGMQQARIATSTKHFPNLGRVVGNTDFDADVVDDQTSTDDPALRPYRAAIAAGVDMIMVSSATYTKIDPDRPAAFSDTVLQQMLRSDLGFRGVIISDALNGAALGSVPAKRRALKFIRAGGDLAIVGEPEQLEPMVQAVRSAAADDKDLQRTISAAATRVLIMKSRHGAANCTA